MAEHAYKIMTGTGEATDAEPDAEIIAAPGAGKVLRILNIVLTVSVVAAGGTGEVALEDGAGGTRIFEADADALGSYRFNFEPHGYPLTANTALNLTVDGAGTTQATARCTAVVKVTG